jgi:hypothetical protein
LAVPQPARAAELEVTWRAPDCASRSDFERRLESALPKRPEALLERPLDVGVVIAPSDSGGFTLQLTTRVDGAELRRELETASCAEAVEAAALIVALAIDPTAEPGRAPPPPARQRLQLYVSVLAGASFREAPAPSPLFGAGAGLGFEHFRIGVEGAWVLAQHAWLDGDGPAAANKGGTIGVAGAGPVICYAPRAPRLGLLACLNAQAGAWRSKGVGVSDPAAGRELWLASAARLGLRVRIHQNVNGIVAGDLLIAWRRPSFVLEELGEVYRPGPLGVRLVAGIELGGL